MILLVAYGGGHVAMLTPIAQTLTAQGQPFIFLALTTAKSVLDRLGIPSIGFRDLPEATDSDAQRWGIELAGDLPVGGLSHLRKLLHTLEPTSATWLMNMANSTLGDDIQKQSVKLSCQWQQCVASLNGSAPILSWQLTLLARNGLQY